LKGHGAGGGPSGPRAPAGWYPNPDGQGQRYWDGAQWTEHYSQPQAPAISEAVPQKEQQRRAKEQERAAFTERLRQEARAKAAAKEQAARERGGSRNPVVAWWNKSGGVARAVAIAVAALVLLGVLGALLPAQDQTAKQTADKRKAPTAKLVIEDDGASITAKHAYIQGRATPSSAEVTIDGKSVRLSNGHFRYRVRLKKGENIFSVSAAVGDSQDDQNVTITRTLTAAERRAAEARRRRLAAIEAERARQRKIQAEQRRLQAKQNFINAAQTIPYNQLDKSPEKYSGTKVKYTGQIFQIQEDPYGGGGNMLLSVTDEGYGLWDDNVWVDYSGSIKSAEKDIITVYGVVKGSKSYDTQIGGSTYVPQVKARYIEE
jgi:hypothetical protein